MKIRLAVLVFGVLFSGVLFSGVALAQAQKEMPPARDDHEAVHAEHMKMHAQRPKQFDRNVITQLWQAWDTLDPKNPGKFYVQMPGHMFFDVAPLKYNNWSEYENGTRQMFSTFKSLKTTVNPDLSIHDHGDSFVVVTSTLRFDVVTKEGKNEALNCRWTSVWVYMGDGWKIMHEHVSVPMQS